MKRNPFVTNGCAGAEYFCDRVLLDKDFITQDKDEFYTYDLFFVEWLRMKRMI